MSHLHKTSTTKTARPVLCVRHAPYHVFLVRVNWPVDLAKESWPLNVKMILVAPNFQTAPSPGGKIIIYIPGAPLMVPHQEFSTSRTEPAHRYQIHMLTGPYLLFWNQSIGNKGSYWVVQILWLRTVLFEITYISKLLSSTL